LPLSPIKTFSPQAPSASSSTLPPPYSFASPKDLYKIAPSGIRPQSGDPLPRNGRNGVAKGLVMDTRGNFKMHYANDGRGPPQRTSVLFGDSPIKDAKVSYSIICYYTKKKKKIVSICTSIHICLLHFLCPPCSFRSSAHIPFLLSSSSFSPTQQGASGKLLECI
jgi:hypothetical protein